MLTDFRLMFSLYSDILKSTRVCVLHLVIFWLTFCLDQFLCVLLAPPILFFFFSALSFLRNWLLEECTQLFCKISHILDLPVSLCFLVLPTFPENWKLGWEHWLDSVCVCVYWQECLIRGIRSLPLHHIRRYSPSSCLLVKPSPSSIFY